MTNPSPSGEPPAAETKAALMPPSQCEFELEFFGALLQRNRDHIDALRCQVELLARRGDYETALELDRRLVQLQPRDYYARYNLACTLSMLGRVHDALQALETAFQLGYRDLAHLEADSDLDALRAHPQYARLMAAALHRE